MQPQANFIINNIEAHIFDTKNICYFSIMTYRLLLLSLCMLWLCACKKDASISCENGNCFVSEGQLWDNLNNQGAVNAQLAIVWNTNYPMFDDTLFRYQTNATGHFKFYVPKDKLNYKTAGYALRLIDPDYQTYEYKYVNNLYTFQAEDLNTNVPIQVIDTVVPVVSVRFNFPSFDSPRTAIFSFNLNDWGFQNALYTLNNESRSVSYWTAIKFNQPTWISYHGTIDGIPFGDSSYVNLKHRQAYQINIQQ